jgi:hypothetical protein
MQTRSSSSSKPREPLDYRISEWCFITGFRMVFRLRFPLWCFHCGVSIVVFPLWCFHCGVSIVVFPLIVFWSQPNLSCYGFSLSDHTGADPQRDCPSRFAFRVDWCPGFAEVPRSECDPPLRANPLHGHRTQDDSPPRPAACSSLSHARRMGATFSVLAKCERGWKRRNR